jgi:hypothetical protein
MDCIGCTASFSRRLSHHRLLPRFRKTETIHLPREQARRICPKELFVLQRFRDLAFHERRVIRRLSLALSYRYR